MLARTVLCAALLGVGSLPAAAQESIRIQVATGHPPIFLWVKHIRESFMPTVDAELARSGKYKMQWAEAYSGTLAKIGSEVETLQQGLADLGTAQQIFQPSKLPLNNVTYYVPFGPSDTSVILKAADYIQTMPELAAEWSKNGLVYLAPIVLDNYALLTNFPIKTLDDLKGRKIGAAGPNLAWLRGSGAVGVQTNLTVLYNDIKSGVFDGTILFLTAAVPAKIFEVAPHLSRFDFGAMFSGAIAVNKSRWDRFPEEVKAAWRRGANAYKARYIMEQSERVAAATGAWTKAGGTTADMSSTERAKWIRAMPNGAKEWLKVTGANGRAVLAGYMDTVRNMGFKFPRDFDRE